MKSTMLRLGAAILMSCGAMAAISGCKGPDLVMAPNTAAPDPLPEGAYPEIVLLSGLETKVVKEAPVVTGPGPNQPLRVRVPIRSVVDDYLRIKYRFMFSTEDGEQLTTDPVWHEKVVAPRTRVFLDQNALSQRAKKWQLEVKGQ